MKYKGIAYSDEQYKGGYQKIPGKIMCAYYDIGGEGVAYHDEDGVNHGSGELNPVDGSYLHSFRIDEGVSTSYVKYVDEIDNNPYNSFLPDEHMLYVGWTKPGNWINITVDVEKTGIYAVSLLYTSRFGGKISLSVNEEDKTGPIDILTTYTEDDPVEWRQWHHWNLTEITSIELEKGINTLTIHTLENGNMNYAYLNFVEVSESKT